MNKLKARGVLKKHDNQSFYVVTQKGFSWLWLQICSDHFFKNPMISKTIKNEALQLAAQPSQIEEAYDSIQRGLSKLTQRLAINPCP
jgi:predicted transcriptional regulator